jgi:hypothetical protein
LKRLEVDPSLLKPEDKTMLEDLIRAAHADAKAKLESRLADEMQKMSREMGLPDGFGGLFGQLKTNCHPRPCDSEGKGTQAVHTDRYQTPGSSSLAALRFARRG